MARDGLSIADVQRLLWEHTRTPLERWPRDHWPKLEERGYVEDGVVPLCATPEQFLVAVAGGDGGHHALYFCSFGLTWSVSVPFLLEPSSVAGEVCELPAAAVSARRRPSTALLRDWARRWGDRPAVIGGGATLSFAALDRAADGWAAALERAGCAAGARVGAARRQPAGVAGGGVRSVARRRDAGADLDLRHRARARRDPRARRRRRR